MMSSKLIQIIIYFAIYFTGARRTEIVIDGQNMMMNMIIRHHEPITKKMMTIRNLKDQHIAMTEIATEIVMVTTTLNMIVEAIEIGKGQPKINAITMMMMKK